MGREYTTKERVEKFLNKSITMEDALFVEAYIMPAEEIINNLTGRFFRADEEASARLFDGDSERDLLIDDAIEITKVEVGDDDYGGSFTEVDPISGAVADGYFKYPANYDDKNIPITSLILRSRSWMAGKQNNRITAKWGYSEVPPADIQQAATILAAGIYNFNRGGATGNIKSEKIGNYSVAYDVEAVVGNWGNFQRAKEIIDKYRKWSL